MKILSNSKLILLMVLIAFAVQADEPEKYWYDDPDNYVVPYVLTITDDEEPYFYELPDYYALREDCVAHAIKIFLVSEGRTYTGFVCERGRADK